jgi:sugar/nucleoside kinase (ribokinase family)
MAAANEVVCAGILVADHVCTPMERLPDEGHLVAVERMFLLTGGCAANVGVNVAKQGLGVRVLGAVGDDSWGRFVREDLQSRGVDTGAVRVLPEWHTSQTMILLCKGQDRRFVHTFGANGGFRASDVDLGLLDGARVFYLGGYLAMPGLLPDDLAGLFAACRERGVRTVLDVVVPTGVSVEGQLAPVLRHTDVFLPNNDEAEILTGEYQPERQARRLLEMGVETVVVTMGDEGLLFARGNEMGRAAHFPSEVLDQTGAGDAFCAGFITGMVRGLDLAGCVAYGSALGASCVRSIGCYQGVFDRLQAEAFLAEHPLPVRPVAA